MKSEIPFTPDQLKAMFASYASGASLEAVGFEFGISKSAVLRRMQNAGIPRRRKGSPLRKKDLTKAAVIRELLAEGVSRDEICHRLGIHLRTYYRRLKG